MKKILICAAAAVLLGCASKPLPQETRLMLMQGVIYALHQPRLP